MDDPPKEPTHTVRWVDTDAMLIGPLTKVMESTKLVEAIEKNYWSTVQPVEPQRKTVDPAPEDLSR